MFTLVTAFHAHAYSNWQTMSPGVPLAYSTAWSPFGGKFTLNEETIVELSIVSNNSYGMEDGFELFNTPACTSALNNTNNMSGAGMYNLKAGTYYFYCSSVWGPGEIMYTPVEAVSLNITDIAPAAGSVFGPTANDGFLSLTCDFTVYVDSWQLVSKSYTSEVFTLDRERQGTLKAISIYVKDMLCSLYSHGLKEGDEFSIKLSGITDAQGNIYGTDGTLTLTYTLGAPAIDLASTSLSRSARNKLLSYYIPGEESALISFTFTGPFDPTAEQLVAPFINNEEGLATFHGPVLELACVSTSAAQKVYYEGVCSDDNTTVTFDISGFDFGGWGGALGADGAEPTIKVYNIRDLNGNTAIGSSESTPGGYVFATDYCRYQTASFDAVWTPAAGSKLGETTSVEISTVISGDDRTGVSNRIRGFDCVRYENSNGAVIASVPFDECTMTYTDPARGILTISCPTPAKAVDVTNVTVTVYDLVTCDNKFYAKNLISATFNPDFTDPSTLISFGAVDADSEVVNSDNIQSISAINVYTDLLYDGTIPTITCSDSRVKREVWYVNTNPSTDAAGNHYYTINLGQPISLTAGNGASVVAEGTTITVSFPAQCFSSNLSDAVYDAVSHTWTFSAKSAAPALDLDPAAELLIVHNLFGIEILRTTDPSDLSTLAPGLYLINGRQTFLR